MTDSESIQACVDEINEYGYWVSVQSIPADDPTIPNADVLVQVLTSPDKAGGQRSILSPHPTGKTVLEALTNALKQLKGEPV